MQIRVIGLVMASALAFNPGGVFAAESETELLREQITTLQRQLQLLSQRLENLESQQQTELAATATSPGESAPAVAAVAKRDSTESTQKNQAENKVEIATGGNLLKFASGDGNYQFQLGGRVQADTAVFDSDLSSFGNDSEIRRARIFVSGTLFGDWRFKNQIEFTGSNMGVRDSYLRYIGIENTSITVGNFKEPFSQEELASSNHVPFIERAPINEFAPSRNLGVGVDRRGTYRDSKHSSWNLSAGIFGEGINDREVDDATGVEIDEGLGFTGRFSTALLTTHDRLTHLGVAYSYRNPGEDDNLSFSSGIEADIADRDLVSTGLIGDVNNFSVAGLEVVTAFGPLSVQGEYIRTDIDRSDAPDLSFSGYYVYASWFLSGESRAAAYNKGSGVVRGIKPLMPLGSGGSGAWELVARFSHIDLTDQEIIGGQQDDFTFGVNWYPNANLRFSFNYINILNVEGGESDNDQPAAYLLRAQVVF